MNRLPVFFAAPHRMMFFTGAVNALLAMLFWSLDLGGRYAGFWTRPPWPLFDVLPAPWFHAVSMLGAVFPFFVFGFILTAGPRWQGVGNLPQRHYLPAYALLASGWLLVWCALVWPVLLAPGLALACVGWGAVALTLTLIACRDALDRQHIVCAALAVALGACGLCAFLAHALGWSQGMRLGIALEVWGFLLPIFVTVAHRMLPFFTASALRGYVLVRSSWPLYALLAAGVIHGLLAWLELPQWSAVVDLPAAGVAMYLSRLWWSPAVRGNRLLAVLHYSFAWLGPVFLLFGLNSLMAGRLGLAPLHALTLGFFASMMIGMVSRVTMGHSGQPLQTADSVMWRTFWLMQTTAALRMLAELPLPFANVAMWGATVLWLAAFGYWATRYFAMYWRARADGKPG